MALQDIRDYIPKTRQTDPNNFPRAEFRRYPLMILDDKGQPFRGLGNRALIVHNPEEEEQFYKDHPTAVRPVDAHSAADELQKLRDENAKLRALKDGMAGQKELEPKVEPPSEDAPPAEKTGGVSGMVARARPMAPKPGSKLD